VVGQRFSAVIIQGWLVGAGCGTSLVSVCVSIAVLNFNIVQATLYTACSVLVAFALSMPIALSCAALARRVPDFTIRYRQALCMAVPIITISVGLLISLAIDHGHSAPMLAYVAVDATLSAIWCWGRTRNMAGVGARRLARVFG